MATFYLDNCVPRSLKGDLSRHQHQATHTQEIGNQTANDAEQLLTAVDLGAVFVTNNGRDFILLNRAWQLWRNRWGVAEDHPGVLILRHNSMLSPEWAEEIHQFVSQADPKNQLYRWDGTTWSLIV